MERINPDTGLIEESTLGFTWEPKRDEDGNITRINPETKIVETSTLGFMWDKKRDDEGRMTRSGPDGVVETSTLGFTWDEKRDDEGRMTRSNRKTGVTEESTFGVSWELKRDSEGHITRRNKKTGVIEESTFGVRWDPVTRKSIPLPQSRESKTHPSSPNEGGYSSDSSQESDCSSEVHRPSRPKGESKLLFLSFCCFLLGILLMAFSATPKSLFDLPSEVKSVLPPLILGAFSMLCLSLVAFKPIRTAFSIFVVVVLGAAFAILAFVLVVTPSLRFGVVNKGLVPRSGRVASVSVAIAIFLSACLIYPVAIMLFQGGLPSLDLAHQVLFIVGCVGFVYMYFRTVRSYLKRHERGAWHR